MNKEVRLFYGSRNIQENCKVVSLQVHIIMHRNNKKNYIVKTSLYIFANIKNQLFNACVFVYNKKLKN